MFDARDLSDWLTADYERALTALRIGKTILESGVEITIKIINENNPESTALDAFSRIMKDELTQKYVREAAQMRHELMVAQERLHELRDRHDAERIRLMDDTESVKDALSEVRDELSDARQSLAEKVAVDHQLDVLTRENQLLQTQLEATNLLVKQSTNSEKGRIGQSRIEDFVRHMWPAAEIIDMSGTKCMSDIHVRIRDRRYVIESKNKEIITADDVRKSLRDIEVIREQHADFAGYLFVSLRSCAIPTKGNIYFEYVNGIPVSWVGVIDDIRSVANTMIILVALAESMSGASQTEAAEQESLVGKLRQHVETIARIQKLASAMKTSLTALQDQIDASARMFAELIAAADDSDLACPRCQKIYVRKSALVKHMEKCK